MQIYEVIFLCLGGQKIIKLEAKRLELPSAGITARLFTS
jgi:hypothetical protein